MRKILTAMLAAAALAMAGCAATGSGQAGVTGGLHAWIDAPLDGSTIPLAPYEVVSHGTDPGGIAEIEMSVNGTVYQTDASPNASVVLVTMRQSWAPPGPGNYTLMVRAHTNSGDWSDYAKAVVTVAGATATSVPSSTRPDAATATVAVTRTEATSTAMATASPLPPAGIDFAADPSTVDAGQCTVLRWRAENVSQVTLDEAPADVEGSRRDCPARTNTYTLRVTTLDGQTAQYSMTVTVRQPTSTATASPEPSVTDTPVPGDITPPVIIPDVTVIPVESATSTPAVLGPPPIAPSPTNTPASIIPPIRIITPVVPPFRIATSTPLPTATPTRRPEIVR
ncbi:MAG: hypothetical protein M1370_12470 [Bacteroidetes bacterium]|nr:hypothetical protein [Bacteroidota bacterium]